MFQYSLQNKRLFVRFFRLLDDSYVLLNLPPAHVLLYAPQVDAAQETKAAEVTQDEAAKVPA